MPFAEIGVDAPGPILLSAEHMDKPTTPPSPPAADPRPYSYERHGVTIEDPWHWLREYPEVKDPEILAYLTAENEYFEAWANQHRPLIDQLFEEMKGRIKEDDSSVPLRDGEFLYWWAFTPGAQYRTWYRKPVLSEVEGPAAGGGDQVILDEPAEAAGKEYFRLGALEVSPDGKLLATLDRRQGLGAFPPEDPGPCERQGHRDRDRGRDRPTRLDER